MGEKGRKSGTKTSKKENNNEEHDSAEVNAWSGGALCACRTDECNRM